MAIEPELRELLTALADGQINLAQGQLKLDTTVARLAEGQLKLEATVDRLAQGQLKLEGSVDRLAQGQVTLAEGQLTLEATVDRLAEGQTSLAEAQLKLVGTVAHLASATEGALTRLTERMDGFREVVLKGFTNGAERDRKLGDQVRSLGVRVTRLERRPTGGRSKKRTR